MIRARLRRTASADASAASTTAASPPKAAMRRPRCLRATTCTGSRSGAARKLDTSSARCRSTGSPTCVVDAWRGRTASVGTSPAARAADVAAPASARGVALARACLTTAADDDAGRTARTSATRPADCSGADVASTVAAATASTGVAAVGAAAATGSAAVPGGATAGADGAATTDCAVVAADAATGWTAGSGVPG
jgi:hypothetical protein